jgi:hypothetical protein
LMNTGCDIVLCERETAEYIDLLTAESPDEAEGFCTRLLEENKEKLSMNRAVSGAYARCLCRFLLHKKNKSRLMDVIKRNGTIRRAVFGSLNTCKYSLIFILKRVFRQNDAELTREVLALLADNPFRDDTAKSYADRWSLNFILDETMKAPADYLNLSGESLKIIEFYNKKGV